MALRACYVRRKRANKTELVKFLTVTRGMAVLFAEEVQQHGPAVRNRAVLEDVDPLPSA